MTKQQKWDCFLITSFYKRPGLPMYQIINIYNRPIEGLLRTPKGFLQNGFPCRAFVCNCLKKLSSILWDKSISDAYDIAITLPNSYDTSIHSEPIRSKTDKNENKKIKRKYRANALAFAAEGDYALTHAKSKIIGRYGR